MLKKLLSIFLSLSVLKLVLSTFIHVPFIAFDESNYIVIANRIFNEGTYFLSTSLFPQYPPLYPLIISWVTPFNIDVIPLFNSFISTLIVFPAYYLSREFLNKNYSLITALIVGLMPPSFIYTFTAMSENLFLPLFLTSVLFIYKAVTTDENKQHLLAGIFISLTILTKLIGVTLIPSYFLLLLYYRRPNILGITIPSITLISYIILNNLFSPKGGTGYGDGGAGLFQPELILSIATFLSSLSYLLLAGAIIAFILALTQIKKHKVFFTIIITHILIISYIAIGGTVTHGRYFDCLFPLIFIMAMTYKGEKIPLYALAVPLISLVSLSMLYRDIINAFTNAYTYLHPFIFPIAILISLILIAKLSERNLKRSLISLILFTFIVSNTLNFVVVEKGTNLIDEYCGICEFVDDNEIKSITVENKTVYDDPIDHRIIRAHIGQELVIHKDDFSKLLRYLEEGNAGIYPQQKEKLLKNKYNVTYLLSQKDLGYTVVAENNNLILHNYTDLLFFHNTTKTNTVYLYKVGD